MDIKFTFIIVVTFWLSSVLHSQFCMTVHYMILFLNFGSSVTDCISHCKYYTHINAVVNGESGMCNVRNH